MIRSLILTLAAALPAAAFEIPEGAHVFILGEYHDNADHHLGQADLIRAIQPKAVVFEMLSPEQAEKLNASPRDDAASFGELINWDSSSWPDYELYQPIFEALGDLPVIGAAAARADVRRAFSEGAAATFGTDAAQFGLDAPVPAEQLETRKALQFDAHCEAMPIDMMSGMVEAQRYRDATFAAALLDAVETYGPPVVLIAGNGHARVDWGVPAMIATAAPELDTVAVGFLEEPSEASDPRFDHTIVTPAIKRDDPCKAFKD